MSVPTGSGRSGGGPDAGRAPGGPPATGPGAAPGAGPAAGVGPVATHHGVKPRLRGWIHAGVTPVVVVASVVLVAMAPTTAGKVTSAIFGVSAVLLFGTSAVYHRGTWSPRTGAVLRRLDHTNIFLIIAGTYTPLTALLLPWPLNRNLLVVVWSGALAGLLARVFWLHAPRWFYVPVYVALGWVAVWFLPDFLASGGAPVAWLIGAGGLAYTTGAVVYGTKRPNPSPQWFGFHEIFHVLTVVGYGCHYVAVSIAVHAAG